MPHTVKHDKYDKHKTPYYPEVHYSKCLNA
jgi:hypothetical protein